MNLARVADIARAVLYEGYILYPYRPSSIKNRQRWTFGGVFPRDYAAHDPSELSRMQTECLLRGGRDALLDVHIRFLHIVLREVGELTEPIVALPGDREPAFTKRGSLTIGGRELVAWEEAVEREVACPTMVLGALCDAPAQIPFAFSSTRELEPVAAPGGPIEGLLVRSAMPLAGEVRVAAEPVADGVFRVTVRVDNLTPLGAAEGDPDRHHPERHVRDRLYRERAQRHTLVSTHTILGVENGAFVSLLDPPPELKDATARCENLGTWPVLVGENGRTDTMLSSPIILYDYPEIAGESPGDLFDGTEIDEILTLRVLAMTDAEKREMVAADPQARALLERTEALTPADFARLHGRLRRLPARDDGAAGLSVGDHVRLRPKSGGDIMDLVLKDEVAVVEAIERDFEGRIHVAVTILSDPGRDMGLERMPGHRFFFAPDEVEILAPGEAG